MPVPAGDSVSLDPHKAMQCSYGVGAVVVQREQNLTQAFAMHDVYCPPGVDAHDDDEDEDSGASAIASIADMGLELTRESRGAQFWLPLRAHGIEAYAAHLDWCLDATQWLADELRQSKHIEIVTPATLCTFTFRVTVPEMNGANDGQLAQWLVDDVNGRGALIAPTQVQGTAVVRVWCALECPRSCFFGALANLTVLVYVCSVLSCRTSPERLEAICEDIRCGAARVAGRVAHLGPAGGGGGRVPSAEPTLQVAPPPQQYQ